MLAARMHNEADFFLHLQFHEILYHIVSLGWIKSSVIYRAVDSFSNPWVLVLIDCLSLFLSSFLNPKFRGALALPAPPLSTALNYRYVTIRLKTIMRLYKKNSPLFWNAPFFLPMNPFGPIKSHQFEPNLFLVV